MAVAPTPGDRLRGGASKPNSLCELRLWLAGSAGLASSFAQICDLDIPRPGEWEQRLHDDRPDLLLVEASRNFAGPRGDELDRMLASCERTGIPRLLWITDSPLDPYWLGRCDRFSRVFTADESQLKTLEEAGAWMPSPLWPATALPLASGDGGDSSERGNTVVWLGGWQPEWPEAWRERLASVLRGAARRGLRIFEDADVEKIPSDLRECVSGTTDSAGGRRAVLRNAAVVICADPAIGSLTFSPPVLFDAVACGAAVITPHRFSTWYEFSVENQDGGSGWNLISTVDTGAATIRKIDLLLDEAVRTEVISHLQRIVRHNHTYSHRLATLTSAVGCRFTPDGFDSTST